LEPPQPDKSSKVQSSSRQHMVANIRLNLFLCIVIPSFFLIFSLDQRYARLSQYQQCCFLSQ
jgi:hypothetical protein